TLPRARPAPADPTTGRLKYSGNDRACRLAGVMLAWNVPQHFYAYFDVVETDWPAALQSALAAAAEDEDEVAYLFTLRKMMAALVDGHARVYHDCSPDKFQVPLVLGWAEGQLVVTAIGEEAGGLQLGDVIVSIDGVSVDEAVRKAEPFAAAATPQRRRLIVARALVQGEEGRAITYEAHAADEEIRAVTLNCTVPVGTLFDAKPEPFCELEPGIFYLHLKHGTEDDIAPYLPQLAAAKGIVIDIRNEPGVGREFIRHLSAEPLESAIFKVPVYYEPDQRNIAEHDEGGRWRLEPQEPLITAKLVVIVDASTQSYLECIAEFFEAYKLGAIVGEASSGSNGNVNPFELPGGYTVHYTGMVVLKNDGSQHHGVGIQPTVPVDRTIAGIAAGRDEYLEAALEAVRE
ncbi:hypothetical protein JW859_10155, partial [bacterium]|nr:hypothetical protein [bacterium]